jgi:uncharacterized protein YbaP (TraB family)
MCIAFAVFGAYGQTKPKVLTDVPSVFDSVWLWQVDTPTRRLYIAGELHDHAIAPKEVISHRLAYEAYESSSRVLTESVNTTQLGKNQLKNSLTPSTWAALDKAIRKSVVTKLAANKNLTVQQRNVSIDDVVGVINSMSDARLFLTLPDILRPLPAAYDGEFRNEVGFLKKIVTETHKDKLTKQIAIETLDSSDTAWSQYCGQPSDTESLISEILNATGPNAQLTEKKIQELTNEFRSSSATIESITQRIKKTSYWETLNKCSVRPRNLEWMKRILQEIGLDKQPLMVVVGIGHVVGDTGLLSLLCKEGYCQSKRIKQVDFLERP